MNIKRALEIVAGATYCDCRICCECRFHDTGKCPTPSDEDLRKATEVLIEAFDIKLEEVNK